MNIQKHGKERMCADMTKTETEKLLSFLLSAITVLPLQKKIIIKSKNTFSLCLDGERKGDREQLKERKRREKAEEEGNRRRRRARKKRKIRKRSKRN